MEKLVVDNLFFFDPFSSFQSNYYLRMQLTNCVRRKALFDFHTQNGKSGIARLVCQPITLHYTPYKSKASAFTQCVFSALCMARV